MIRAVRAIAGLRIADSLRRVRQFEEARQAYAAVANRADAPLHCRARPMLAAGDMHRDAKRYEAARRRYGKTRDFLTGKREAFRVDALEWLRDIKTLADTLGPPMGCAGPCRRNEVKDLVRSFGAEQHPRPILELDLAHHGEAIAARGRCEPHLPRLCVGSSA